jgi:hypothetical protein
VHWTLLAIGGVLLLASFSNPGGALIGLVAYVVAFLVHEGGHLLAAQRLGYRVHAVELYAFHALTRFDHPATRYDHALIAAAGVGLQAVVGIPLLVAIKTVGYTPFEIVNALLAFFSFFCVVMVFLNLIPVPPLDGHLAWQLVPMTYHRLRAEHTARRRKRSKWAG